MYTVKYCSNGFHGTDKLLSLKVEFRHCQQIKKVEENKLKGPLLCI